MPRCMPSSLCKPSDPDSIRYIWVVWQCQCGNSAIRTLSDSRHPQTSGRFIGVGVEQIHHRLDALGRVGQVVDDLFLAIGLGHVVDHAGQLHAVELAAEGVRLNGDDLGLGVGEIAKDEDRHQLHLELSQLASPYNAEGGLSNSVLAKTWALGRYANEAPEIIANF